MQTGAITGYIDVAQVTLYVFWIFFAGLILYLRREDKREGYPLENERSRFVTVRGFPNIPKPKAFKRMHGQATVLAPSPDRVDDRPLDARPIDKFPGSPLEPLGDPMTAAMGPSSYAMRADVPELDTDGTPNIVPMRSANGYSIAEDDPDLRGWRVVGADNVVAGTVTELWIDKPEPQIRYLEVSVPGRATSVLVPMVFAKVEFERRWVKVRSVLAKHFADAPSIKSGEQVTKLEEDKIQGYFGGGTLYALPERAEPLL